MEEWITIAQFDQPSSGYVLKSRLEAEGIRCFLKDENVTNILPLESLSMGGIKLQVPLKDGFRALEIYYDTTDELGNTTI
jgi:hypothetical protein